MYVGRIGIHTVLLEVLLASSHQLDGSELVAVNYQWSFKVGVNANSPTVLESRDDRANKSTLST